MRPTPIMAVFEFIPEILDMDGGSLIASKSTMMEENNDDDPSSKHSTEGLPFRPRFPLSVTLSRLSDVRIVLVVACILQQ